MKKYSKKLSLNKKTIANLADTEMKVAHGGVVKTGCIISDCCGSNDYKCILGLPNENEFARIQDSWTGACCTSVGMDECPYDGAIEA